MKKLVFIIIIVLSLPINLYSNNHPIKLTSSEIKYDSKAHTLRIECKVFSDDFAPAIHSSLIANINRSNLSKNDLNKIEYYFLEKYKIVLNGARLPWKIESYEVESNVLSLVFFHENITIDKGSKIEIENSLLFEVFGDLQSNWITMRFPPYLPNYNFESYIEEPVYSYTF